MRREVTNRPLSVTRRDPSCFALGPLTAENRSERLSAPEYEKRPLESTGIPKTNPVNSKPCGSVPQLPFNAQ